MSEPTGPIPSASEGWPPAPPMNPNPVTESYPGQAPAGYVPPQVQAPTGYTQHPAQVPTGYTPYPAQNQPQFQQVFIEKSPQQLEGEKFATTSTIFGIISIFFAGVIFGPLAIVKAAKAEKLGVDATVGKVTGWIGAIMAAVTIVISLLWVFIFGAIIATSDTSSTGFNEPAFGNSKNYDDRGLNGVAEDAAKQVN